MSKKKRSGFSRRDFLKFGSASSVVGLSQAPTMAIFSSILQGHATKALAQEAGFQPKALAIFYTYGGLEAAFRGLFTPRGLNSGVPIVTNPNVGTRFSVENGRLVANPLAYELIEAYGKQVPSVYNYHIPTTSGGTIPVKSLLPHHFSMNGVNAGSNSHEAAQLISWQTPGATQGITALVGDGGFNAALPAIAQQASTFQWLSNANKSYLSFSTSGNWLESLLSPFRAEGLPRDSLSDAFSSVLGHIDRDPNMRKNPSAAAIAEARRSAAEVMESVDDSLEEEWNTLQSKYQGLINQVVTMFRTDGTFPGLNDLPISRGGSEDANQFTVHNTNIGLHDVSDFRRVIPSNFNVSNLANAFAFSEYVLTKGLTGCVSTHIGAVGPFRNPNTGTTRTLGIDAHESGVYSRQLGFTLRWLARMACQNEFTNQLDLAGIGEDVITCSFSEFSRIIRVDGTGSDHGGNGSTIDLWSKSFKNGSPLAIGNLRNTGGERYLGFWGDGGVVPELGEQVHMKHFLSTLSYLLGVPSPITAVDTLITKDSAGRLISQIGESKIVGDV